MTHSQIVKAGGWRRVWRWVKRILLSLLVLVVIVVLAGAVYEALGRRSAARQYPPPGKLVDIGGRKIHLDCRGSGSPTVILESGLGSGGSVDWTRVHDRLAAHSRTCAYDRAGIMWSDPKQEPQDAVAVAHDLHAALKAAGISGPLVLAGHSIGGPYVRVFTGLYGDQVAGLVLVDSSHPDQTTRLASVVKADLHPGQMMGLVRTATALSWTGVVRFVTAGKAMPNLPPEAAAKIAAYTSLSLSGAGSELAGFDRTMDQARQVRSLGDRPLIVLTAMAPHTPAQLAGLKMTAQDGVRMKQMWKKLNAELAALSTRGRQRLVPDAGHYIQIDRPDVVVAAVREVVDDVRGVRAGAQQGEGK